MFSKAIERLVEITAGGFFVQYVCVDCTTSGNGDLRQNWEKYPANVE